MINKNMIKNIKEKLVYKKIDGPIGVLTIAATDEALKLLLMNTESSLYEDDILKLRRVDSHPILDRTEREINLYFQGKLKEFDIPLAPEGTEFQKKAWNVLRTIPYGEVYYYEQQAKLIGDFRKARAVGQANSVNPIAIIIPCHRVIGKNGKLTGFAGGLNVKEYLLELEKRYR